MSTFLPSEYAAFSLPLLLVDDQFEHVGARVVPDGVMLHLAGGGEIHVKVGVDYRLFVPDRLGRIVPVGVDDAAAAAAHVLGQLLHHLTLVDIGGVGAAPFQGPQLYRTSQALPAPMLFCIYF